VVVRSKKQEMVAGESSAAVTVVVRTVVAVGERWI